MLILKSLNTRMDLPDKEKQHYLNLKKGYEGETQFDLLTEKLQCECYILNDLLLTCKKTVFQIDTVIITEQCIYFFEVKNYEGDYYYEGERIYKLPKTEITNPLIQLKRNESLLRQLLQKFGFNLNIYGYVVFINPEFTLYQSPLNKPFLFPPQVNRHLDNLNSISSKLNNEHKLLAEKLISLHMINSPFTQLPSYDYYQLQKGITCNKCTSFSISIVKRKCICTECGHKEVVEAAVMRSVKEFKLLFPQKKITTNLIYDWFKVINSKKRIRKILNNNLKKVGIHQWTYYE